MLYDSDAVRTRAPSISSLSPPLSLSLGIRSLYIKRHQTVVSQLCLQVLSRLSGQNAEDPSIQVFLPGGLMYGLNHARCSGVSSIQDPGQSSFSAKKVVHQWLRGMGQRVGHANYESWFRSCTGGWRMSCIKCMLTQRRLKRWRHVIDQYWSYILVPCSCVCCCLFVVYAGIGICVTSVFMHVSFSPEGGNRTWGPYFIPQIAIAIGVLTSNRGEGDEPLWLIGRGTRVPLQGAVDVVPLLGAIAHCHCSVLWLGGNFGGVDGLPLLGAIVVCYGWVPAWRPGVDVVPLQGANGILHSNVTQKKHLEKLPWASCRRYTVR